MKKFIWLSSFFLCFFMFAGLCIAQELPEALAELPDDEMVVFSNGFLSVNAVDVRAEELMKEIGEKGPIKVVLYGDVFSEIPISIKFEKMALRKGIERILKSAQVSNYLLHFDGNDGNTRIVQIDLIGTKGGQRYLTEVARAMPAPASPRDVRQPVRPAPQPDFVPDFSKEDIDKLQENFMHVMDDVLRAQLEGGTPPNPEEIIDLFKDAIPPDMKDKLPAEVLEQMEQMQIPQR